MLGLETSAPIAKQVVAAARDSHGLLINATGETTLRIVPPLTISAAEVDEAVMRLTQALTDATETAA
jgi:acetylornithine/succinyldiaminopimelate/putrescine aminotransferase